MVAKQGTGSTAAKRLGAFLRSLPKRGPKAQIAVPEEPAKEGFGLLLGEQPRGAEEALELLFEYGHLEDPRELTWLADQAVRKLTGERYEKFLEAYAYDDFGHSHSWDQGVAPRRAKPEASA